MIPTVEELAEECRQRFGDSVPAEPTPAPVEGSSDAPAEGAEPAEPPGPCQIHNYAEKGFHLDVTIPPDRIVEAVQWIDGHKFALDTMTPVDWPDDQQIEIVYDFLHFHTPLRVAIRTRIPRDQASIASITDIYPGANWQEREAGEFYGITFDGHPNQIHLMLPDDMVGYPMRKDFKAHA